MRVLTCMTISLAWMAPAVGASELASLMDLPVAGRVVVPAAQFRDAAARAACKGSPVGIALAVTGSFEGKQQLIVQVNEGAESPSASRVTVIRDGLLDDALRSERWDIDLACTGAGRWKIGQVTKSWRCWRGAAAAEFAAQPCP